MDEITHLANPGKKKKKKKRIVRCRLLQIVEL